MEIDDEAEVSIFRGVRFTVQGLKIFALVRGDLRFAWRNLPVGMRAEQNLAQSFARKKSRLRALQLYFFQFLAPFAFKFAFGERCFSRQLIHQSEQRLSKFR